MTIDVLSGYSEIIKWLSTTVIALSGWITLLYNWFTSKPKIRGQILNVIIGTMRLGPSTDAPFLTGFNVYIYLTNTRKNTVHIRDYELEVDTGTGYERIKRYFPAHKIGEAFFSSETHKIEIPKYPKKLITSQAKPLKYGVPLHGFVLFASEKTQDTFKDIKKYKVTCVDAFGGRHKIISDPKKFPDIYLLQELAGITLRPL